MTDAVWLQLGFPLTDDDVVRDWLEGSLSVWKSPPRELTVDTVDDSALRLAFNLGDGGPSSTQSGEVELGAMLSILPLVYSRGMFRAAKDAFPREPTEGVLMFPAVGFIPPDRASDVRGDTDAEPEYWTLRMNIGVIGNLVVTIRLQDLRCAGLTGNEPEYRAGDDRPLEFPNRFVPLFRSPDAQDIAEAIALHQAATARAASEELRERLSGVERGIREDREASDLRSDRVSIWHMQALVDQLDRQLSRLLRRFGPYGEADQRGTLLPREVRRRYQFALDEILSLGGDCRLAGELVSGRISDREQAERTQFEEGRKRFEVGAALFASLILVPTLIAGFFGANVSVPGENSTSGAIALGLLLLASAGGATLLMGRLLKETGLADLRWVHDRRRRVIWALTLLPLAAGFGLLVIG